MRAVGGQAVRALCCSVMLAFALGSAATLAAQKDKPQPLTEPQIEQIREAGIYPDQRIGLYTKFIDQHAETVKSLSFRAKSAARVTRLDTELQDLTALMDELGSNLDEYSDRKADLRKSLKNLNEAAPRWLNLLRALAGEPGFELSRKEAIESCDDLADQAKRLLTEQTDYFNAHKDEKGQQRAEPK
jgi:hypothetical protein